MFRVASILGGTDLDDIQSRQINLAMSGMMSQIKGDRYGNETNNDKEE